MELEQNEIVRVKPGNNDQGHGKEEGVMLAIEFNHSGVLIAGHLNDGSPEKEAYKIGFPPIERYTDSKWYFADQLEKV